MEKLFKKSLKGLWAIKLYIKLYLVSSQIWNNVNLNLQHKMMRFKWKFVEFETKWNTIDKFRVEGPTDFWNFKFDLDPEKGLTCLTNLTSASIADIYTGSRFGWPTDC